METRRFWRLLGCAAIALLLAGCFKVNMDLEVSADDMVSGTAVIAVDESCWSSAARASTTCSRRWTCRICRRARRRSRTKRTGSSGSITRRLPLSEFAGNETLRVGRRGKT